MLSISQLKQHLKTQKSCSLQQLCVLMQEDKETVRFLLRPLINKGHVCERRLTLKCGSVCSRCHEAVTIMYDWLVVES